MEVNCCCAPQPCPACGFCPCCGRGRQIFYPAQPWNPYPYPGPIWIGSPSYIGDVIPSPNYVGDVVQQTTTGIATPVINTTTCTF
jgi:hypothetical protein